MDKIGCDYGAVREVEKMKIKIQTLSLALGIGTMGIGLYFLNKMMEDKPTKRFFTGRGGYVDVIIEPSLLELSLDLVLIAMVLGIILIILNSIVR